MRDSEFRSVSTLFLMCGLPGAGKTTLARRLEQEYAAVRLTPDEWISKILPADWSRDELDRLRSPVESLQWTLAERLLALGTSVVLDWGLWGREERDVLRDQARALGAHVVVHYLNPPRDELVARLSGRGAGSSTSTFVVTEDELDLWAGMLEPPTPDELALR